MTKRVKINKLKWAKWREAAPPFKPKKHRGSRAAGLAFEYKVARKLKVIWGDRLFHGRWIDYEDAQGKGLAQPDVVIEETDNNLPPKLSIYLIECKLCARVRAAKEKMEGIYLPLIKHLYPNAENIYLIQIAKHFPLGFDLPTVTSLEELKENMVSLKFITWRMRI